MGQAVVQNSRNLPGDRSHILHELLSKQGTGPRPMHVGPQGKSEISVQRAVIIVIVCHGERQIERHRERELRDEMREEEMRDGRERRSPTHQPFCVNRHSLVLDLVKNYRRSGTFLSPKMASKVASVSTVNPDGKMELTPEELETVKVSRLSRAHGLVDTTEEAAVRVKDLDMFVTVQLLEDTPAELSLGKLCGENAYPHGWKEGRSNTKFC